MALMKLGALAQDVRGSLNGTVFSRNRGGAYVRSKVSPCQPISQWSGGARGIFKSISQAWSCTLTDVERGAWEAWAALHPISNVFGDAVILPGVAAYQAVNARLSQVGIAPLTDPPESWAVPDMEGLTVVSTWSGTVLVLTVTPGRALTEHEGLYVLATRPLPGSRGVLARDFRLLNSVARDIIATPYACAPAWISRFYPLAPAVDLFLGVQACVINVQTGATSAFIAVHQKIVAPAGP